MRVNSVPDIAYNDWTALCTTSMQVLVRIYYVIFKLSKRVVNRLRMQGDAGKRSYTSIGASMRTSKCPSMAGTSADDDLANRTLIDALEPRLLFSAEHPLGLFMNPAEITDADNHAADERLVSQTMELLQEMRSASLIEQVAESDLSDDEKLLSIVDDQQDVTDSALQQSDFTGMTVESVPLFDDANSVMLMNDGEPLTIIDVSTLADSVDADNLTSYADFDSGLGGDNEVSLREAIIVANADPTVDIIRLPDGIYHLTLDTNNPSDDINAEGDLDLDGSYTIQGESEDATIIEQGVNERRVFELRSGNVVFEDLMIKGGSAGSGVFGGGAFVNEGASGEFYNVSFEDNTTVDFGGALFAEGDVTLDIVTITDGAADLGGGIYIDNTGSAVIRDSIITRNMADDGGGIFNAGNLTLLDSLVEQNSIHETTFGDIARGAGIYNQQSATALIEGSVIRANTTNGIGGGVHNNDGGMLTIRDSSINENVASIRGGGINNDGNATLERVNVAGNTANATSVSSGGGIYNSGNATLDINHSIVANNTGNIAGAGIQSTGNIDISDSTIINNSSTSTNGAGGIGFFPSSTQTATLTNTIVANNFASGTASDVKSYNSAVVNSDGFNLVEASEGFDHAPTDIVGLDPLLGIPTLNDDVISISVDPTSPIINTGRIASAGQTAIDGSIIGATPDIGGLVSDTQGSLIFWAADSGTIYRTNSDNTFHQKIIEGIGNPLDIQVDAQTNRVYWLNADNYSIESIAFDGSGRTEERLVNEDAVGFTIDSENQRFFVAVEGIDPKLLQYFADDVFNNDVDERQGQLIRDLQDTPTDIDLDADSDTLYWSEVKGVDESSISSIQTVAGGQDPTIPPVISVVDLPAFVNEPYAIVVDDAADVVYWTEPVLDRVFQYDSLSNAEVSSYLLNSESPFALAHDVFGDRLFVANDNEQAYWVDLQAESVGGSFDLPETATQVVVAALPSDEPSPDNSAPTVVTNAGVALLEGETILLTNAALQFVDDNTKVNKIRYTQTNSITEIEIFRNGIQTTSFTQQDIDNARISLVHTGSINTDSTLTLEFTVADENGLSVPVSFDVLIENIDEPPQLVLAQPIEVQQGIETLVTLDNISATDVDTADADLQFSVSVSSEYEFLLSGGTSTTFSQQDVIDGNVQFSHFGTQVPGSYQIAIQVSDAASNSADGTLNLTVTPAPVNPTFAPTTQFTVAEGGTVVLDNAVLNVVDTDTAAIDVQFTVSSLEGGQILVANALATTFTLEDLETPGRVEFSHLGAEPSQSAYVELTIADEQMEPATLRIDMTVTPVNDNTPVAIDHLTTGKHGSPLTTVAGTQSSLLFSMTDADEGPVDTFTVEIVDQPAGGTLISDADGTFEYTPGPGVAVDEEYRDSFTYQIRDSAGNVSTVATVDIVIDALQAPVLVGGLPGIVDVQISELDDYTQVLPETLFSSPEGAVPLSWDVTSAGAPLPAWLGFDPLTRTLSGTPLDADVGTVQIDVVVTDTNGLASTPVTFDITAQDINQAPVFDNLSGLSISENVQGDQAGVVTASDPDASDSALVYSVTGDSRFEMMGSVLTLRADTSVDFELEETISVDVEVRDSTGDTDSTTLLVSVVNENDAPTLQAQLPDQELTALNTVIIGVGRFTDQDNDVLTYSLALSDGQALPDWIVFDSVTTEMRLGIETTEARTAQLALTVDDARGGIAQMLFNVSYTPPPVEPAFTALSQLTVAEGGTVALNNTVLNVVDPDTVASDVNFTVIEQVGGVIWVGDAPSLTFTQNDLETPGRVEFKHLGAEPSQVAYIELTIADEQMIPAPLRIDMNVTSVNDNAPVAIDHVTTGKHGAPLTTVAGTQSSLLFSMTDADEGPADTFSIQIVDQPADGILISNTDGTFEYTPPQDSPLDEEYRDSFTYQISDSANNVSNTATVQIIIDAHQAPVITVADGLPDVSISELDAFTQTLSGTLFSSAEGALPLTWSVTNVGMPLPAWLSFDPLTRTLSGIPSDADTGTLQIDIVATDTNGLSSSAVSFQLDVRDINQAPTINSVSNQPIPENMPGAVVGTVDASDPDRGDRLAYSVNDERFEIVNNELKLRDDHALDYEQEEIINVDVEVRDNAGITDTTSLLVRIVDENDAPVVQERLSDQQLTTTDTQNVAEGRFSDQDNDTLVYSLTQTDGQPLPSWIAFDPDSTQLSLGDVPSEARTAQLVLIASDNRGGTAQMLFGVHFVPEADEPETIAPETIEPETIEPETIEPETIEPETIEPEIIDPGDILPETVEPEPVLQAASEVTAEPSISTDFDQFDQGFQQSANQESSNNVLGSGVTAINQSQTEDDSIEPIAAVSVEMVDRLLGIGLSQLLDSDESDGRNSVLRNNAISEFLNEQKSTQTVSPTGYLQTNVFDDNVNLASLFSQALPEDSEMYSTLADEFGEQREETDAQIAASRILSGSSVTVTSGLSIGYILYLLRGGAIMSSMLTSLPAWRFVDPLPILGNLDGTMESDSESLQSIVTHNETD